MADMSIKDPATYLHPHTSDRSEERAVTSNTPNLLLGRFLEIKITFKKKFALSLAAQQSHLSSAFLNVRGCHRDKLTRVPRCDGDA